MAATSPTVSRKVLLEILRSFIHAESLPSHDALSELSAATGLSVLEIREDFSKAYAEEGHKGDPWAIPD